jgi:hypothetical protein
MSLLKTTCTSCGAENAQEYRRQTREQSACRDPAITAAPTPQRIRDFAEPQRKSAVALDRMATLMEETLAAAQAAKGNLTA